LGRSATWGKKKPCLDLCVQWPILLSDCNQVACASTQLLKSPRSRIKGKSVQRELRRCTRTDMTKLQCPFPRCLKSGITELSLLYEVICFVFCYSPKSPPNSPNTELSTDEDLKGVYINYCYKVSDDVPVVFSVNVGLLFYHFAYMK